jgi:hypothetical protein
MDRLQILQKRVVVWDAASTKPLQHRFPIDRSLALERRQAARGGRVVLGMRGCEPIAWSLGLRE